MTENQSLVVMPTVWTPGEIPFLPAATVLIGVGLQVYKGFTLIFLLIYTFCHRCISNCNKLLNPDARLSLECNCKGSCEKAKYQWKLESSTPSSSSDITDSIWPNKTLTPINSSTLVIKALTFKENHTYVLRMEVTNEKGMLNRHVILLYVYGILDRVRERIL